MLCEVDQFLAAMLPRHVAAEHALCRGDADPRSETWSHRDPVTLFGAAVPVRRGWDDVSRTFRWLADRFSELHHYEFELVTVGASGDLAYTVGFEHKTVTVDGESTTYTLRVTQVYRREDGVWKVVHRHGDHVAHNATAQQDTAERQSAGAEPATA
jgi:ketosteroid isomerase-like protein